MTPSGSADRLTVGVIGAGRVGAPLASALRAVGHEVGAASGISEESRERLETLLPNVPRLQPEEVAARAELVLLTVPDDALRDVVSGIAAQGGWRPGQIVLHTSGVHVLAPLSPASDAGALPVAFHPAMTFTGTSLDVARLEGAPIAITSPPHVVPIGHALAVEIGGEPIVLEEENRALYHAALTHSANHVAALIARSQDLLAGLGIENPGAVLRPLVVASVEGALAQNPGSASNLTGPVVRGDVGTITAHLEALAVSPEAQAEYRAGMHALLAVAHKSGRIDEETQRRIRQLGESFE